MMNGFRGIPLTNRNLANRLSVGSEKCIKCGRPKLVDKQSICQACLIRIREDLQEAEKKLGKDKRQE